jgi:hypothetical protein
MAQVKTLPPEHRKTALKAILDSIDPALYVSIGNRASQLQSEKGHAAPAAVEKAVGSAFATHFLKQLHALGKGGRPGSLTGLGAWDARNRAYTRLEGYVAVGNFFSDVGKFFSNAGKTIGHAASDVGKAILSVGKTVINGVGKLACAASKSGVLASAAGAAGMAFGGPTGGAAAAQGAGIAKTLCGQDQPPPAPPPSSSGGGGVPWLLIGAVGVGAVLLLR